MAKRYRAKIQCNCELLVWLNENDKEETEIEDIEDVLDIDD